MIIDHRLRKLGICLTLLTSTIIFIAAASGEGFCDYSINPGSGLLPITLPPFITIDPNPAYVGQTITIRGSGFNTTTHQGDSYPTAYCNAYCDEHGTLLPIKIQSDGTFVIQPAPKSPGSEDIYAWDNWGGQSNKVKLTVTYPVTIQVKIYDMAAAPYTTNGVLCMKYPASGSSHYENTIIGSTYTMKMAFNGTSAEVWVRQNSLTTDHKTIQDIQEGQTYTVSLTMPVNSPTPSAQAATPTPTPSQTPQATTGIVPTTLPGTNDTVAPVTTLNLTGIKDANGAFTSNVVCTLTAADNEGGSGVNDTSYSFDGSYWTSYAGPFTISTPGNTSIFYRSADRAGNQEIARVEAVTVAGSVGTATAATQQGSSCCPALLLPLLSAGFVGLYEIRKRRQK